MNTCYTYHKEVAMKQGDILQKHIDNGVQIVDIAHTYIEENVQIEEGTVLYPNVSIRGNTYIGKNNVIDMNTIIIDSKIGHDNVVVQSVIEGCEIGNNNQIGPFAHLRPNTYIGDHNQIGNFVEVKSTVIKDENYIKHLSYLGDATLESQINVGAGAVIANYNAKTKVKSKAQLQQGACIGANTVIVSPSMIGKDTQVAAGSIVTGEIPDDSLVIVRGQLTLKENYYKGEKQ